MKVLSFDHVAVVVRSMPAALALYVDTLGATLMHGADDDERGMRTLQLRLGGMKLELLQPLSPLCHLTRYLDRFGEGFHHMTLLVPDVQAAAAELESAGYEVVDLRIDNPEWREAYVRPRSGFGTLIQIADSTRDWQVARDDIELADVLAGQYVWFEQVATRRTPEMGLPVDQRPDWKPTPH